MIGSATPRRVFNHQELESLTSAAQALRSRGRSLEADRAERAASQLRALRDRDEADAPVG